MVRKLRSPKPLSIAKNERKRIEVWLFFKMGLQCDAHKHRNHGWWILNRKSRIPDHKQSTCLWDQGPQSSKEKMTGHSQGSHCPECAWIWQLSTPVQSVCCLCFFGESGARRQEGNWHGFCHCPPMNSLRQFVDINKQVLSTTWPKMGEKNPTSVLCLKSTERSMLVKDTVSWTQVY